MLNGEQDIVCPYCWEKIGIVVDVSVPEQEYIEDCFVCCRPIVVHYRAELGQVVELEVRTEAGS